MAQARYRPDKDGTHRRAFERAKRAIMATQTRCGICGAPVDKSLKYPHPLSACIDHIIPIDKGGHPSDPDNLQLAHLSCNRAKSDKLFAQSISGNGNSNSNSNGAAEAIGNRALPQAADWAKVFADL
ncbi:MAG: HNH endonuclease [Lachnospiraceae bacterium]|nr:HNH endonuclease [Lachnospiraceae bacterium]